jgi:hypothetical protein
MARWPAAVLTPWNQRALTIPPCTRRDWLRLALWELWMGMLLCGLLGFGALLIVTARDRIVTAEDLSGCYASPPVVRPCERIVYRTGLLNAAFSVLAGVMSIVAAAWFLWELWNAVAPRPITDDFLKLLNDSFGRSWRDPRTWPWSRLLWAYGFTAVGATMTAGIGLTLWMVVVSSHAATAPAAKVETSQIFRLGR